MSKNKKVIIEVQGTAISIFAQNEEDYLCLTDIARYKNAERTDDLVRNWLRDANTITFPGGRGSVRAGQTSGRVEGGVVRPAPSAGASPSR